MLFYGKSMDKQVVFNEKSSDEHATSASGSTDTIISSSSSLDNVLSNMKDALKSLKSQVTRKTLHDLNREMTPFDLPALSPVPQRASLQHQVLLDMQEVLAQDRVHVEEVLVGGGRVESEDEPGGHTHNEKLGDT
jgi:hypothetical protein